jgi:hypothetical protein
MLNTVLKIKYILLNMSVMNHALIKLLFGYSYACRTACMVAASSVIVAHNHPSGDLTPSRENIEITKKLADAGKIMGIDVVDHVIIGHDINYGFKECGIL